LTPDAVTFVTDTSGVGGDVIDVVDDVELNFFVLRELLGAIRESLWSVNGDKWCKSKDPRFLAN
jgi:hypothetical protein